MCITRTMLILLIILSKEIFCFSLGGSYCSKSNKDIFCIPCVDCRDAYPKCYVCPVTCDGKCNYVCNDRCQNGNCEYTNNGGLKCTDGCITGATGIFCREWCPWRCKDFLCHQLNSTCHFCKDGFTGDYCDKTLPPTTTLTPTPATQWTTDVTSSPILPTRASTISVAFTDSDVTTETTETTETSVSKSTCLPPCVNCAKTDQTCCTKDGLSCENEDVKSKHEDVKSKTEGLLNMPLILGLALSFCLTAGILPILYKLRKVYRMQFICSKRISSPEMEESSDTISDHGYSYIDGVDLDNYCKLSSATRTVRRPKSNTYLNMGNRRQVTEEKTERVSVESTTSETMFGNLFETADIKHFSSRKYNSTNDNVYNGDTVDYDKYLLPTENIATTASSVV